MSAAWGNGFYKGLREGLGKGRIQGGAVVAGLVTILGVSKVAVDKVKARRKGASEVQPSDGGGHEVPSDEASEIPGDSTE